MQVPLQITFRHMDAAPALEARPPTGSGPEEFYDRITNCHVTAECQHHHHRQGNLFEVGIDLVIPGREIIVGRNGGNNHAHEDARVAVRDAFDGLRRRVEDSVRIMRRQLGPLA